MKRKYSNWTLSAIALGLVLLIAVPGAMILHGQAIMDRITVMNFSPSASIQQLSDRSEFTDHGEFLFLASQPVLEATQSFNDICRQNSKHQVSILGCYTDRKIYIYDIDDERLDGIREVTAAHEMLHAAYDRLGGSEREWLRGLLDEAYRLNVNEDLESRMAYYDEAQPGHFYDELHSILATEYRDIGDELEEYFSSYFKDRLKIVDMHEKYHGTLTDLRSSLDRLSAEMTALRQTIDKLSAEYRASVTSLNNDISSFNKRANSGYYQTQSQFYYDRQNLVSRSNNLAKQQERIDDLTEEHNQKVREYNEHSVVANELHQSIDSTIAPPPSL